MYNSNLFSRYKKQANFIASLYILGMIIVFPIFNTDKYFNILGDRAWFFTRWTTLAAIAATFLLIAGFVNYCIECRNAYQRIFPEGFQSGIKRATAKILGGLSIPDMLAILLFISFSITTILSPWRSESFTGSSGRMQGLFTWACYIAAYFLVSRYYRPQKIHLEIFLGIGALLALWGITDYIGLDLFGWISEIKKEQRGMFTSSFGNINTYTQVMAVYAAACAGSLQCGNTGRATKARNTVHLIELTVFMTALITGQSDNAVFGIAVIFILLPFLLWNNPEGLFLSYAASVCLFIALLLSGYLTDVSASGFSGYDKGILLSLCQDRRRITAALFIITVVFISARHIFCRRREFYWKALKAAWTAFVILCFMAVAVAFADINFISGPEKYGSISKFLLFNNNWGTYRGFAWKTALKYFFAFPFHMKLFGSGLETFGILTRKYDYEAMMSVCGQVFDSPHNEALQFLVTSGVMGCALFYGWVASCLLKGVRQHGLCGPAWMAAVSYIAVSLVSISVPIAMPYCILALSICARRGASEPRAAPGSRPTG